MSVTTADRRIESLHPVAQKACRLFLDECKKAGVNIFITETHRSQERQNWLYAQGRTRPGQVVTWTLNSNHKSGLAWDIAVSPPQSLYDVATLNKAGAIARRLGIEWGGDWKGTVDRPHFQVKTNWTAPVQIASENVKELQRLLKKVGYKLVVDGLDGPATTGAVKDFQGKNNLVVDGSAGPLTMDKLNTVIKEMEGELTLSKYKELLGKIESLERKLGTDRAVSSGFENDWKWAEDKSLLDGSRPSHPVTREQLAAVLHRFSESNNLTPTAKGDLKELLEKAYNDGDDGVFTDDHSQDVESMPGHQILNLLISYVARTAK